VNSIQTTLLVLATSLPALGPRAAATPAQDDPAPQDLLDALLANGALTAEQHAQLSVAEEEEPTVRAGTRGYWIESADGESNIKIGGRVQVDAVTHDNEGPLQPDIKDGTELRRARFEMKGDLPDGLNWAAEVDFAGNKTRIKDFWVGLDLDGGPTMTVGHQKQPFSLDIEMSSNDIPFVERGIDAFLLAPFADRAIGIRVQDNSDSLFYAAGVYGESIEPLVGDDEGWGVVGRLVAAPVIEDREVLHLGLRGTVRFPENGLQIRDESSNMSDLRVVDTGTLDVQSALVYGAEAVWAKGPFSVGGEYNLAHLDVPGEDLTFSSWHGQLTYSLTGESRAGAYRMSAGEFKRLRAETPEGRPWELAARWASIDLEDGPVAGGEEDAFTAGLNWYYSPNVRLMLNWTNIFDARGGSATTRDAEDLQVYTARVQFNF
jgi:phosphate-selective porin OprO/OprP